MSNVHRLIQNPKGGYICVYCEMLIKKIDPEWQVLFTLDDGTMFVDSTDSLRSFHRWMNEHGIL